MTVLVSMLLVDGNSDLLNTTDLFSLEVVVLRYFDWNLYLPTCCYITEFLLNNSLSSSDLKTSFKLKVCFNSFADMRTKCLMIMREWEVGV